MNFKLKLNTKKLIDGEIKEGINFFYRWKYAITAHLKGGKNAKIFSKNK